MRQLIFTLFFTLTNVAFAQQVVLAGGGNATGSGGTVSFSIGQVAWNMYPGANGSIIQGVQQPYEISVISGVEEYEISLNYAVYPNPTRGKVTLNIDETDLENLRYQLFSMSGVMLEEKNIEDTETEINLDLLPSSTYFLRIIKDQVSVKLLKIVKN